MVPAIWTPDRMVGGTVQNTGCAPRYPKAATHTALRAHDSLAAFTAAGRHVGDVELWVRDRLDAVRDRR